MRAYLVVFQFDMDDLPIGLFAYLTDALEFSKDHPPLPTDEERRVFGSGCSTPNCISIITFVEGKPTERTIIRKLND